MRTSYRRGVDNGRGATPLAALRPFALPRVGVEPGPDGERIEIVEALG